MLGILDESKLEPEVEPLRFHNTLSGKLDVFTPQKPPQVTMYTCGPTVYDYATIGNFRAYVFADLVKRTLLYNKYEVAHTMNLTDFGHLTSDADFGEDKMMRALKKAGMEVTLENMAKIADTYSEVFKKDALALNILPPDQYTRASEYVKEQIALIKTLEQKGYTYEISDGVYFDISRFPTYGKLGNIDLESLKEGARIDVNPEKKHPADFAVWKKGRLGWESSWGKGFPGWHIECTAMVFATLGKQIDIHTGGVDHITTHHNGEIAQAEAATGKSPYVRYWMHNAFITIDEKKISKSLGNFLTLRDLEKKGFTGVDYRYWLLTSHYRSPVNFTLEALEGAQTALLRLKRFMFEHKKIKTGTVSEHHRTQFHNALNNDLDTPRAIALMWELIKEDLSDEVKIGTLMHFDEVLALDLSKEGQETSLGIVDVAQLPEEVQELITEREEVRKKENWKKADTLRNKINDAGYDIEDTKEGVRVTKK